MAQPTVVLITGSKSGIGNGLLAAYAKRPNTLAIAAIRDDPDSGAAKTLTSLPTGPGSNIIVVQYDAGVATAGEKLEKDLREKHAITHLDIIIANAGILKHFGLAKDVKVEDLHEHLMINTIAPVLLYQRTRTLLLESTNEPKFIIISSDLGSNARMDNFPMPMIAYDVSKAAVNFAAGRIHREEDRLIVIPVQPGWVQTSMGGKVAALIGMDVKDVPITLDASVSGLIDVIDSATKKDSSGKFLDQNGSEVPW